MPSQAPEFLQNSLTAAPSLLGYKLVHVTSIGRCAGIIVETEAYRSSDPASHSFRGITARNEVMFGPAGRAYVYFTYGMHHCLNVVCGPKGDGQAVLIRALEPTEGLALMQSRRGQLDKTQLTNGPAKLVQAMGISDEHNGVDLLSSHKLWLEPAIRPAAITQTTRIGISKAVAKPWRFYISSNRFVSKTAQLAKPATTKPKR